MNDDYIPLIQFTITCLLISVSNDTEVLYSNMLTTEQVYFIKFRQSRVVFAPLYMIYLYQM